MMFLIMQLFQASWHFPSLKSNVLNALLSVLFVSMTHSQPQFANNFKKFSHTSQVSISQYILLTA
jgi:hypothetical protein